MPEMAVAACDSRKTQTRRVMPQPHPEFLKRGLVEVVPQWPVQDGLRWFMSDGMSTLTKCDYKPGDCRCLLTTWAVHKIEDFRKPTDVTLHSASSHFWHAGLGTAKPDLCGKSRPGRFLPNHLRPLMPVFEIVTVSAEQVQDISAEEAMAEGIDTLSGIPTINAITDFHELWDSINAKRGFGWSVNPWVWVIGFKRV